MLLLKKKFWCTFEYNYSMGQDFKNSFSLNEINLRQVFYQCIQLSAYRGRKKNGELCRGIQMKIGVEMD